MEIWVKYRIFSKIKIIIKNRYLVPKSIFFFKNRNYCRKSILALGPSNILSSSFWSWYYIN